MSSKRPLDWLEISFSPFKGPDGRTYRVFGTETERLEYRWSDEGVPELVTTVEHRHHVLCEETDERWWIPHDRVKKLQQNQPL